ncbi:hypothetical protein FP66_06180 [Halomonas salina]|uniref:Uncharacterized protein n=1 Tax=Halomonas salina TaxID=42565 RepID=A0ABR4WU69_9GAMM|nr:hypothetical protein FP66_06180 [Halomonas salina]
MVMAPAAVTVPEETVRAVMASVTAMARVAMARVTMARVTMAQVAMVTAPVVTATCSPPASSE